MRSVLPLRVVSQVGPDTPEGRALIHAIFRAYWSEDRDIADPEVVTELAKGIGLDGAALVAGAADQAVKDALKASTLAAVTAGVFGAPTFIVHPDEGETSLYWGVDRMALAARAARGDTRLR